MLRFPKFAVEIWLNLDSENVKQSTHHNGSINSFCNYSGKIILQTVKINYVFVTFYTVLRMSFNSIICLRLFTGLQFS